MAKKGLGRGLNMLLGDDVPEAKVDEPVSRKGLATVPIEHLKPDANQPRKSFLDDAIDELARSIKAKGLLQPILVRPSARGDGTYEIVAGERRWRAAQKAGVHQVPVIIKELSDAEAAEIALIENVQRVDLNPMEEAEAYAHLMKTHGRTQNNIADAVGKSRSHIANMTRLNSLPKMVREQVRGGHLTMGHARALINAPHPEIIAKNIMLNGLSVRETERIVREAVDLTAGKPAAKKKAKDEAAPSKSADIRALERDLAEATGLDIALVDKGKKGGTLTISYTSIGQLDDVCAKLSGQKF